MDQGGRGDRVETGKQRRKKGVELLLGKALRMVGQKRQRAFSDCSDGPLESRRCSSQIEFREEGCLDFLLMFGENELSEPLHFSWMVHGENGDAIAWLIGI